MAKAVQLLKGNSSKWIHDTFEEHQDFEWQQGYGAFSVSASGIRAVTRYILRQPEHHRRVAFKHELEVFIRKYGMEYVEGGFE